MCTSCGCDLPGVETLCRDCFYQQYWEVNAPKRNFWQWLGRNGDAWLLGVGVSAMVLAEYYVLARSPRLMHAAELLGQAIVGGMAWVLTPWILITEWKQERTLRALFFGVVFIVQLTCAVLWWTRGTQLWFQIGTAIFVIMFFYGLLSRAFGFLKDV